MGKEKKARGTEFIGFMEFVGFMEVGWWSVVGSARADARVLRVHWVHRVRGLAACGW